MTNSLRDEMLERRICIAHVVSFVLSFTLFMHFTSVFFFLLPQPTVSLLGRDRQITDTEAEVLPHKFNKIGVSVFIKS